MNLGEVTFQNRREELELLLTGREARLLNIYGEAGIGKTRLLCEAVKRLRGTQKVLAVFVDLARLVGREDLLAETLLRAIIDEAGGLLRGDWLPPDQVAAEIVAQLNNLAQVQQVCLFLDTTEKVQDERGFWDWLEEHLAGPLAIEGRVCQVYAGRVRAPWRRIETRRYLMSFRLLPLRAEANEQPVVNLVSDVLDKIVSRDRPAEPAWEEARYLIGRLADHFSCGHPGLAQEIAVYLGQQVRKGCEVAVSGLKLQELKNQIAEEVIGPFVDRSFLTGLPDGWPAILREACVLDWFDSTVLKEYLEKLRPSLPGEWDQFFIQGMADLTRRYAVVEWDEQVGAYRLAETLREILRRELRAADPEKYRRASLAIAEVLEEIADGYFRDNHQERERLLRDAERYRSRAKLQEEL